MVVCVLRMRIHSATVDFVPFPIFSSNSRVGESGKPRTTCINSRKSRLKISALVRLNKQVTLNFKVSSHELYCFPVVSFPLRESSRLSIQHISNFCSVATQSLILCILFVNNETFLLINQLCEHSLQSALVGDAVEVVQHAAVANFPIGRRANPLVGGQV